MGRCSDEKEEEKEFVIHHPITYVSGLFKGELGRTHPYASLHGC